MTEYDEENGATTVTGWVMGIIFFAIVLVMLGKFVWNYWSVP